MSTKAALVLALSSIVAAPLLIGSLATAAAQTTTPQGGVEKPDTPANDPKTGPSSGTAPGNEGSTGWTGGTGGSFTGTSNHAPTPGSPTAQPETVEGVNPKPGGPSSSTR
ncbi:hypothetical protein [Rhodoplanes elegans]|uniref:hypothetical protein n=1 Tax=Rhodoplanes elegans TaxID=29408 RepID=UPI0019114B09|nr:hypothetical protein [Rhodoplanes elegans]